MARNNRVRLQEAGEYYNGPAYAHAETHMKRVSGSRDIIEASYSIMAKWKGVAASAVTFCVRA